MPWTQEIIFYPKTNCFEVPRWEIKKAEKKLKNNLMI